MQNEGTRQFFNANERAGAREHRNFGFRDWWCLEHRLLGFAALGEESECVLSHRSRTECGPGA